MKNGTNRDDFSEITKTTMAKRVGYHCSNPACKTHTVGPHEDATRSISIGVAAHITAASVLGPRFDHALTEKDRSAIENGIWLCASCSVLIDRDADLFTVELLQNWKVEAEDRMLAELKGPIRDKYSSIKPKDYIPFIEAGLTWDGTSRAPRGYSDKNPYIIENGYKVTLIGAGHPPPIIHWELTWRYVLEIHNNSSVAAINLKIESIGKVHLFELGQLPELNNLQAFKSLGLDAKYKQFVEGDHIEADKIIRNKIPEYLNGLILKLSYLDESRHEYISYIKIVDGKVINDNQP